MGFISTLRRLLKPGARDRPQQQQDHARSKEQPRPPDAHATTQPCDDPLSLRFPTEYPVGIHTYDPFVSVEDLQLSLRFFRAFHQLRKKVEAAEAYAPHLSAEERWTAFVRMATRRTGVFLAFAREGGPAYRWQQGWILPLDVALIVHATLTSRDILHDQLSGIEDLVDSKLLVQTAKSIDPSTYEQVADAAARKNWRFETGSHFDPLACFVSHIGQDILGTHGFPSLSVRWLRPNGTGFAEPGFVHKDDAWHGPTLTHEVHGVIKFAQDLWDCMSAPEKAIRRTRDPDFKLPDHGDCAKPWAWVAEQLVNDPLVESATSAWDVAERLGWRCQGVHELLKRHLGSAETRINGAVESGEPDTVAALQNTAQAWQGDVFVYARRVLTPPEEEAFVTHPSVLQGEAWEAHVRCVWESGEARKCCGDGGADDEGGEGLPAYEREGGTVEE
ncbi:hypothetical protein JCM10449v2_006345 [Rhodotorula kratochvilovae]